MNRSEAQAFLATAIAEVRSAGLKTLPAGSPSTGTMAVETASGTVIIHEDGTVLFTPLKEIKKSLQEGYKSIERGHSMISGGAGVPCPTCGGSGRI